MTVGKGDRIERHMVRLGEINDQGIAIAEGLTGNDRVVQSAGAFLTTREKVKPVRAAAREAIYPTGRVRCVGQAFGSWDRLCITCTSGRSATRFPRSCSFSS